MSKDVKFWDSVASKYNKMFSNSKAYEKMYSLMKETLNKNMRVLEVGTASGLVARAVSSSVNSVYAVDYSCDMIEKAKKISKQKNIIFDVQDTSSLEYEDKFFDAVIVSNVLHILEQPEYALKEIKRVLKDDGLLIAPTFMWKEINFLGKIQKFIMLKKNFPIYFKWGTKDFTEFLNNNGFKVIRQKTIKSSFNICYVECVIDV